MKDWLYKGSVFSDREGWVGFVYLITNDITGRKYIGKKNFTRIHKYKPKGKKRARKTIKDSNWKDYFGSSKELQADVERLGKDKFSREILYLCEKKGDMSYLEAREQFDREVLLREDYYNGYIGCKINAKHLGKNIGKES